MFLLAGLKLGSGVPGDGSTRDETYETVQSLAAAFTERCGTTVCGELLAQNEREPGRTCTDYVACAAALVDSMLCGSEAENRP